MNVTYTVQAYYGENEPMHSWQIIEDDQVIAELWVDLATGQIMQVETIPARRGEGLARHLYKVATKTVDLYHSPVEHRTPEGNAFAEAVGGETISDDLAYQPN